MKITRSFLIAGVILSVSAVTYASDVGDQVKKAMKMDYRTEKDTARDANRSPVEALAFMGFKDDMKVIEFLPAGAWYTKIIAPVLQDKGQLYLIDNEKTFARWEGLNDHPAIKKAEKIFVETAWNREAMRYDIGEINLSVKDADMFLNIREYHNFSREDKARLNKTAYDALKSGGKYVIIDHTRRHMGPEDGPMFRREDPVEVIVEVQQAGFVLEKSSNMFYRENDNLLLEVGDKSVAGQTDRFFLVFKKP
ncbi:MAG: methyltransferase [Cellvibrionaceae bacterium]